MDRRSGRDSSEGYRDLAGGARLSHRAETLVECADCGFVSAAYHVSEWTVVTAGGDHCQNCGCEEFVDAVPADA